MMWYIIFRQKRLADTEIRKNLGRQAKSMRAKCEQTVSPIVRTKNGEITIVIFFVFFFMKVNGT